MFDLRVGVWLTWCIRRYFKEHKGFDFFWLNVPTAQKCINVNTSQPLLATPSQGQTPLYAVAWHDQLEAMKLLLEAKANMETADIDGGDLDKPGEDEAVQEWDGDGMDSGV